jgi:hypothetical protein
VETDRLGWVGAGLALAIAGPGVVLVLGYLGSGPRPGPLPTREFSLARAQLPDTGTTVAVRGEADRLVIPSLRVDAAVVAAPLTAEGLQLPGDVSQVALWDGSAPITAAQGALLAAGHLDNAAQEPGALHDLAAILPGADVVLVHHRTVTSWRVTGLQVATKTGLPDDLWAGRSGPRRLYLVTCGGPVVDGHYADNVIVTAVPASGVGNQRASPHGVGDHVPS